VNEAPLKPALKWAAALTVLIALQLLSDWLVKLSGLPLHGSVVGMLLLLTAFVVRGGVPEAFEQVTSQLLRHLMLFLIPSVAAVSLYGGLLAQHAVPFVLAVVWGSALTIAATGWVLHRGLRWWRK
jgi:holin-like protein